MADPKNKGMTAREAVERFCTDWVWAGTFSGDPGDAASELGAMLRHEITVQTPHTIKHVTSQGDRVRRRAKKALKGQKKPGPKKRKQAVFKAMMTARQNPDQLPEPVRLWATGRRVPLDPSGSRELIPTDIWSNLHLDIEGEGAAGKGLEYCDLRIYDADPAQAVSEDAQDAVAIVDAMKACGDQLQQAAELSEPIDPASSAVRPNRRGRKKGTGGYDSKDLPLIEEMHRLITSEEPMGRYDAMLKVVERAEGKTGAINKGKRLLRKYATKYDPDEGHSA